jgi:ATP-binding cassette, subfamily F, member 3
MLTVQNISKSFGAETALKSITFNVNAGERVGLVGPNGTGKTTLIRIIAGEERPDSGHVHFNPPELRVGYLPQGLSPSPTDTIASFLAHRMGDVAAIAAEVESLAIAVSQHPSNPVLQTQYDTAINRLTTASDASAQAPAILAALGWGHLPMETPASILSGGQKTRLSLASILISDPQLLLLDEPTNHLDFDMLTWLETWLSAFKGGVLIVSHDRAFLDAVADRILDLDPDTHTIREYKGNYTDYLDQKIAEREKQWSQWRDQEVEIRRMKQDIAQTKEQSRGVELSTTPRTPGVRRIAKKVARKALSREKKLERYIDADDRVDKPKSSWQMKLTFSDTPASSRDVLILDALSIGYGQIPLLEHLNAQLRYGARAALVGPNGSGKTTLLRTIAGILPPLAGRFRLGPSVRVGYMDQEQKSLDLALNAFDTIRALAPMGDTETRTFLHLFLFSGDDVFTPVKSLSYGERARLSLACLVAQGCNFLLLDEPINHLDIPSRTRFEQALTQFEGTVLTVVHDRYFIASFASEIWEIENGLLTITEPDPETESE